MEGGALDRRQGLHDGVAEQVPQRARPVPVEHESAQGPAAGPRSAPRRRGAPRSRNQRSALHPEGRARSAVPDGGAHQRREGHGLPAGREPVRSPRRSRTQRDLRAGGEAQAGASQAVRSGDPVPLWRVRRVRRVGGLAARFLWREAGAVAGPVSTRDRGGPGRSREPHRRGARRRGARKARRRTCSDWSDTPIASCSREDFAALGCWCSIRRPGSTCKVRWRACSREGVL